MNPTPILPRSSFKLINKAVDELSTQVPTQFKTKLKFNIVQAQDILAFARKKQLSSATSTYTQIQMSPSYPQNNPYHSSPYTLPQTVSFPNTAFSPEKLAEMDKSIANIVNVINSATKDPVNGPKNLIRLFRPADFLKKSSPSISPPLPSNGPPNTKNK